MKNYEANCEIFAFIKSSVLHNLLETYLHKISFAETIYIK